MTSKEYHLLEDEEAFGTSFSARDLHLSHPILSKSLHLKFLLLILLLSLSANCLLVLERTKVRPYETRSYKTSYGGKTKY